MVKHQSQFEARSPGYTFIEVAAVVYKEEVR